MSTPCRWGSILDVIAASMAAAVYSVEKQYLESNGMQVAVGDCHVMSLGWLVELQQPFAKGSKLLLFIVRFLNNLCQDRACGGFGGLITMQSSLLVGDNELLGAS